MKKQFTKILQGLIGLATGAGLALCILPWAMSNIADDPLWLFEAKILLAFIPALACYLVMIVLHEAGHLVAGLRSGYAFVSFRVLSLTLIRLDGKLRWKRFSLAGTAGQCLMKPPAWTASGIPVQLYNWGGVLANIVLLVLSLPLLLVVPTDTFGGLLLLETVAMNGFALLNNGIPMQGNDADNALHLKTDLTAQRAFWAQMTGNALMAEGVALRDIPQDLYDLPADADPHNPLIAASAVNAAQLPLFHRRFDEADAAMADVLDRCGDALHPALRFLVVNERIWYELMHENRADVLGAMRTREYRQYQKAMRTYPSVVRVLYTQALAERDPARAAKYAAQMDKVAASYPYRQEIDEEQALMQLAREHFAA